MKASVIHCIFYQCLTGLHSQNGIFDVGCQRECMSNRDRSMLAERMRAGIATKID